MTQPLADTPAATTAAPPAGAEASNCPPAASYSAPNRDAVSQASARPHPAARSCARPSSSSCWGGAMGVGGRRGQLPQWGRAGRGEDHTRTRRCPAARCHAGTWPRHRASAHPARPKPPAGACTGFSPDFPGVDPQARLCSQNAGAWLQVPRPAAKQTLGKVPKTASEAIACSRRVRDGRTEHQGGCAAGLPWDAPCQENPEATQIKARGCPSRAGRGGSSAASPPSALQGP